MASIRSLYESSPQFILYKAITDHIANRHLTNCDFVVADIKDIKSVNGLKGLISAGHIVKVGRNAKRCNVYRLAIPIEKENIG